MRLFSVQSFLSIFVSLGYCCDHSHGYVPPEIRQRWKDIGFEKTQKMAIETIEDATMKGKATEDLFWSVKFIDRFANELYKDEAKKEDLMTKANGSWELRLAVNSDRDESFYPHPEFRAFAMAFITIGQEYFGKGIAPDSQFCFVSLGGPSSRNIKRRQVFMNYEDYFINGREVPGWDLSYYLRGYARNWVSTERNRPKLSFTVIAATDKALVMRGSKTGGMAIFRRIPEDMGPAAYGFSSQQ